MGQALYRSYRPKKLGDLVGHEHIATALSHALKKGTISHAYLFTGPRGIGKTTIARILAHEINGLPYDDDATHLDIIEIDAASNRRIDEIRDLRDKVNLAPAAAKYKVYIIDEVHMLTREAFNALLKTLEEPPAHVVFILATTEVHKLPETIVSRTQHFTFRPVEQSKVAGLLKDLAAREKIAISDDALALIAQHGEGSFRDSISLLDQLRNQASNITLADVQNTLGIAPEEAVQLLLKAVQAHDAAAVSRQLRALHEQGFEPAQVARQLGKAVRESLIGQHSVLAPADTLKLLAQLVDVPASSEPRVALEIAVLDATFAGVAAPQAAEEAPAAPQKPAPPAKTMSETVQTKPASITEPHPSSFTKKLASDGPAKPAVAQSTPQPAKPEIDHAAQRPAAAEDDETETGEASTETLDAATWNTVLAALKKQYSTLYGIIQAAQPTFASGKITLTSRFAFHQKRLHEQKNREIIAKTVQEISGHKMQIECVVGEVSAEQPSVATPPPLPPETGETVHVVGGASAQATAPAPIAPSNDPVATVSNIFGGAELLQS